MNNHDDSDRTKEAATKDLGKHALGQGIGAGGGAIAGAAMGSGLGPLGAVTGAVLGGVFGAITGRAIAAGIDPEEEETYWQEHYNKEPYYESEYEFGDYGPAYRLGWQLYSPDTSFESAEKTMSEQWAANRGTSKLEWHQARDAAKAGWTRVESLQTKD
ncbi:MAG: hypothetical protein V4819_26505 [Verrucomicrobiota bacterium]